VTALRVAVVGLGKIARDQHIPALSALEGVELAATVDPQHSIDGIAHFTALEELLAAKKLFDAVALCTPPQARQALASLALKAGKHVLLEKPPGATVSELTPLIAAARQSGRTLFTAWHSRFAPAVEPARSFLADREVKSVTVDWKEDVRVYHPGQAWIWEPGGAGVFDPGINALSIMTRILPRPFFLTHSELSFPRDRAAPIAADLIFSDEAGTPIKAAFDWRHAGAPTWEIKIETDSGSLTLAAGGRRLVHGERTLVDAPKAEYPAIYRRFAELIVNGVSDVDLSPLVHVADAFMLGRRREVEPFSD
jgi:D-galactose 1-dehydrogenase